MSTFLLVSGFFLWMLFTIISAKFYSPGFENVSSKVVYAFSLKGLMKEGPELGFSSLQFAGIVWLIAGIVSRFTGERIFEGDLGTLVLLFVFLGPVAVGAVLADVRRKK